MCEHRIVIERLKMSCELKKKHCRITNDVIGWPICQDVIKFLSSFSFFFTNILLNAIEWKRKDKCIECIHHTYAKCLDDGQI